MEKLRNPEVCGLLRVDIDNRKLGLLDHWLGNWLGHGLNVDMKHYSTDLGSTEFNYMGMWWWFNHADILADVSAKSPTKNIPASHISSEFKTENRGIAYLAHLPISDFGILLNNYRKTLWLIRTANLIVTGLQKGEEFLEKFKVSGTGFGQDLSQKSYSLPFFGDVSGSDLNHYEEMYQDDLRNLSHNMRVARALGLSHMIYQKGFGLAECPGEEYESRTEMIILGTKPFTEKLVAGLRVNADDAARVLKDMFSPTQEGVEYLIGNSSGSSDLDPFYEEPPYSTGEYHPFKNMTELKVFER